MNILAAIKREERKLQKQVDKLQHRLEGIKAAASALGNSASRDLVGLKSGSCLRPEEPRLLQPPENAGPRSEHRPKKL